MSFTLLSIRSLVIKIVALSFSEAAIWNASGRRIWYSARSEAADLARL